MITNNNELREYGDKVAEATTLLWISAEDYLMCRCLYLNGFVGAFVSGSQAVEKIMKSQILLCAPDYKVRALNHDLVKIFRELELVDGGSLRPDLIDTVKVVDKYFKRRYAIRGEPTSIGPKDLMYVDELYIKFAMNIPIYKSLFYTTGLFSYIFNGSIDPREGPYYQWLVRENEFISEEMVLDRYRDYLDVMKQLHGDGLV